MSIETNLKGRLDNTPLSPTKGLLPLFEAVVNSIHAIEDAGIPRGLIQIQIIREPEQSALSLEDERRGRSAEQEIRGFTIRDNGIGFTAANYQAFKVLDTDHKASRGCKGIGRLLWLKAFTRARVESVFRDDEGKLRLRIFRFDARAGVHQEQLVEAPRDANAGTLLTLESFESRYRKHSRKSCAAIATAIFEHCLWYFVRPGGGPRIVLTDITEQIDLDVVYENHMHGSAVSEDIQIKGVDFDLLHIKLRASPNSEHAAAYCADHRLVQEEKLKGKIPGLHGRLQDESGEFVYHCYVSSVVLDQNARPERTGFFDLNEQPTLFSDAEISWEDIKAGVAARAEKHLAEYLKDVKKKAHDRVQAYVATRAPRYRPIMGRISAAKIDAIDPEITDKDLELTLHRHLAEIEVKLLSEGHDIMYPRVDESAKAYRDRLEEYLRTAEDIKKSDLASYVSHRRVIIELLEAAIQRQTDGAYAREDVIHNLIMPMRKDSNEVLLDHCNLWLVDERLAFHDYLSSDKPLTTIPVTDSKDGQEPDLLALRVFDNPILVSEKASPPLASIVIVEIKRPMRAMSGEDEDPIEQVLDYLERIREGKVRTGRGRPIPRSEEIPGFCYVICDITNAIVKRCKRYSLINTSDGLGFFGYLPNHKAYIEVIGFDRLVNAAKERNRAFFDKLGLPT